MERNKPTEVICHFINVLPGLDPQVEGEFRASFLKNMFGWSGRSIKEFRSESLGNTQLGGIALGSNPECALKSIE
jgi:hypothetical protein